MIRAAFFDFDTVFSAQGAPREGARAFISACASRFPLLVTTGGARKSAEAALRVHDLAPFVLDIMTAAEVERPKPAPDLPMAALGRIGFLLRDRNPVEPGECLVVESTPEGVQAARAAQMRSLAIAHRSPPTDLAAADFVRESFAELDLDDILRRCVV